MPNNRKWWYGLLTLVPAAAAMVCMFCHAALWEPMQRAEVSVTVVDRLHLAAILVALAGAVASLIVMKEAPGRWKLTGLPGLILNVFMFLICLVPDPKLPNP